MANSKSGYVTANSCGKNIMDKMITHLFLVFLLVTVSACSPSYEEKSYPLLPDDLSDCKFYKISNGPFSTIKIVRCPNSITSTTWKQARDTSSDVVVIDGIQYRKEGGK